MSCWLNIQHLPVVSFTLVGTVSLNFSIHLPKNWVVQTLRTFLGFPTSDFRFELWITCPVSQPTSPVPKCRFWCKFTLPEKALHTNKKTFPRLSCHLDIKYLKPSLSTFSLKTFHWWNYCNNYLCFLLLPCTYYWVPSWCIAHAYTYILKGKHILH